MIYKKDNIYYITNIKSHIIIPTIMTFIFTDYSGNENNMTSKIKYYNSSIPVNFIIKYNNLEHYNNLLIKYMSKGKIINKTIYKTEFSNKLLYELF